MATVNVTVSDVQNGTITLDPTNKLQWKKFKQLQKDYPELFGKVFKYDEQNQNLSFCVDDMYSTTDTDDRIVLNFLNTSNDAGISMSWDNYEEPLYELVEDIFTISKPGAPISFNVYISVSYSGIMDEYSGNGKLVNKTIDYDLTAEGQEDEEDTEEEESETISELEEKDEDEEDEEEQLRNLRLAAEQGDADAQLNLGKSYYTGDGVEQDYKEAVKWFRLAADQGVAEAQINLGVCYYTGQGAKQNYKEAVKWFRLAAEQGIAKAQFSLGICYANGIGVKEDYKEAIKWYKLAAENGHKQSLFSLALCLYENVDYGESYEWFVKARDAGIEDSWYYLGWLYYTGEGPECDENKAYECWDKVIGEDQADLQYEIGNLLDMNRDHQKAIKWFKLAAKHGNEDAAQWLKDNKATVSGQSKPGIEIKAAKSKTKDPSLAIEQTGPTTKLDFWQAFKPYIDQMRHTEFSKVKIKDDDCLDAKPTVIPGVYNSILIRASKKILRLELYIDTAEEARNLQILDHIQAKMKVPASLKGKVEYERKEGRRAQRVCVSFPGFELSDRSCWAKYMQDILCVADDFFDAV